MPERILGLDIGASALKAVLLSRGFRGGYRLLGFRRIDLAAAGGLTEAVRQLFADEIFRGSVCVTTLPSGALSYRSIRLPFRDHRKIRQTLPFAIEPLIQTPLGDVFIDYTLTGRTGQAEIFAALAPRALVGDRTALLAEYVRETAVIDIDAVPLVTRLMEKPDFPKIALVVDVGARETVAVFASREQIIHIRNFPFGGEDITAAMAKAMSRERSTEVMKRSREITPEASAAIREWCGRLLAELKNTEAYLLWQGSLAQPPAAVILTGGGSQTPGLAEGLAERFAVPVERTDLAAQEDIEIEETLRPSWNPALMDQALALAARPMAKGRGFNFRQRASEARAGYGELRDRMKKGAVAALVVLILAGIEIGLDDIGARHRLAALKRDVNTEFKKSYPDVTRIVDPVAQLKGKIAETRKLFAGVGDAASAATVLDLLKEVAGLAPADSLLTSLTLDGDVMGLKGEARNFDAVDTIKKALANSKYFKTVTIGSTSMIKQGSGVEFDLKITVKK
ncbi:MAG: pilus assembly protein PilM [Deltaproteobacteria bacterium]|nr:pilus assembly protein PilM [Deltaproteobacteria bacterium]